MEVTTMRKTKEDMLITREKILQAGFECFDANGFEQTSLAAIAEAAGVTRGAIYWHFEDKKELFRAVVDYNLAHGDITTYGKQLPSNTPFPERLAEMFWHALDGNRYVEFVYKCMIYACSHKEFNDVVEKVREMKNNLWEFINMELKIYLRMHGRLSNGTECVASSLTLLFEGMFLMKNLGTKVHLNKEYVYKYTNLTCAALISKVEPERWEELFDSVAE